MIIGPFCRLPAAHAASELDIMNEALGLVGAETFAAVDPKNNKKLEIDLWKLASRTEHHRYLFFTSRRFPGSHDVHRRPRRSERDDAVRGMAPCTPGNQGGPDGGPPL